MRAPVKPSLRSLAVKPDVASQLHLTDQAIDVGIVGAQHEIVDGDLKVTPQPRPLVPAVYGYQPPACYRAAIGYRLLWGSILGSQNARMPMAGRNEHTR